MSPGIGMPRPGQGMTMMTPGSQRGQFMPAYVQHHGLRPMTQGPYPGSPQGQPPIQTPQGPNSGALLHPGMPVSPHPAMSPGPAPGTAYHPGMSPSPHAGMTPQQSMGQGNSMEDRLFFHLFNLIQGRYSSHNYQVKIIQLSV